MIENKKLRNIFYVAFVLDLILLVTIGLFVRIYNIYDLKFSISDGSVINLEYGEEYNKNDIVAFYSGTILDEQEEVPVEAIGSVDTSKLGRHEVIYRATFNDLTKDIKVIYVVDDTTPPEIQLVTNEDSFTRPIDLYDEEGFSAFDNYDGDITDKVIREEKDGIVTYTVSDSAGNIATVERVIVYNDIVAPVITLNGNADINVSIGNEYIEEGYVALDDCDGDITDKVITEGNVDTTIPGSYKIEYKVQDSYGNTCSVIRNISVADYEPPTITLKGSKKEYIKVGTEYTEKGFEAFDNVEGDVSGKVVVIGQVDTTKVGMYKISYEVKDESGNSSVVNREIYVYDKQAEINIVNPGNKVVYLTFDDGPGPYTQKLLDILDKYGVKATFFVTGQRLGYKDMIGEAYRRGHTIALHTYSHQYSIYTSEETYYADLKKIEDLCVAQTGIKPTIVRFPGGTSNGVSKQYCKGIMTALSKSLGYHGYLYSDWNVSSGDAGGAKTKDEVANNVINGMKKCNVSIVLQHDSVGFSVDAVETIIAWGLANGYTFLPMTESTPMVHHSPNN